MPGSMEDVKVLKAAFLKVGFNVEVYTDMSKSVSVLILLWCKSVLKDFMPTRFNRNQENKSEEVMFISF